MGWSTHIWSRFTISDNPLWDRPLVFSYCPRHFLIRSQCQWMWSVTGPDSGLKHPGRYILHPVLFLQISGSWALLSPCWPPMTFRSLRQGRQTDNWRGGRSLKSCGVGTEAKKLEIDLCKLMIKSYCWRQNLQISLNVENSSWCPTRAFISAD